VLTPYLEYLAKSGVILNYHYVHPVCSPSRAAFMTGYYASKTNIQDAIHEYQPAGLDVKYKLLPQFLKDVGYKTYLVGKYTKRYKKLKKPT